MSALEPLQTLFSAATGDDVPLTPELARLYGSLSFPFDLSRPLIAGNFVSTLDGVISFGLPGRAGGRAIRSDSCLRASVRLSLPCWFTMSCQQIRLMSPPPICLLEGHVAEGVLRWRQ